MNIPDAIAQARDIQLQIMADGLIIDRPDGESVENYVKATRWRRVYPATGDSGPGRIQPDRTKAGLTDLAGQIVQPGTYVGAIPWDAPEVRDGDRVTVVSSHDPVLVGKRFLVQAVDVSTFATARRFHAEEAIR